jgi:hypothetical protein
MTLGAFSKDFTVLSHLHGELNNELVFQLLENMLVPTWFFGAWSYLHVQILVL